MFAIHIFTSTIFAITKNALYHNNNYNHNLKSCKKLIFYFFLYIYSCVYVGARMLIFLFFFYTYIRACVCVTSSRDFEVPHLRLSPSRAHTTLAFFFLGQHTTLVKYLTFLIPAQGYLFMRNYILIIYFLQKKPFPVQCFFKYMYNMYIYNHRRQTPCLQLDPSELTKKKKKELTKNGC